MMEEKYEFTGEKITVHGRTLNRIRATRAFCDVKEGELGGYIESTWNLDRYDMSWVADRACVYEGARVNGLAVIRNEAEVYGSAHVGGTAIVYGNATVNGNAFVHGKAVRVGGEAVITGNARVCDEAVVYDHAYIADTAIVKGCAAIMDSSRVLGDFCVKDNASITGHTILYGKGYICENARIEGYSTVGGAFVVIGGKSVIKNRIIKKQSDVLSEDNTDVLPKLTDKFTADPVICKRLTGFSYEEVVAMCKDYLERETEKAVQYAG